MSDAPAIRPDVRLETEPMTPVSCGTCGAQTEARKASWEQTSIQWHSDGSECPERQNAGPPPRGMAGTPFIGCPELLRSIAHAVAEGDLRVLPLATE